METVDGAGILDEIARYWRGAKMAWRGVRTNLKPSVRRILEKHGETPITELYVVRTPLNARFQQLVEHFNGQAHDQLFHLFMVMVLSDGSSWIVEKREDINVEPNDIDLGLLSSLGNNDQAVDARKVQMNKANFGLKYFLDSARNYMGPTAFYTYDAFSTNCQNFVLNCLIGNNIAVSPQLREFIMQDVRELVPNWAKKVAFNVTSFYNRLKTLIAGEGVMRQPSAYDDVDADTYFDLTRQ